MVTTPTRSYHHGPKFSMGTIVMVNDMYDVPTTYPPIHPRSFFFSQGQQVVRPFKKWYPFTAGKCPPPLRFSMPTPYQTILENKIVRSNQCYVVILWILYTYNIIYLYCALGNGIQSEFLAESLSNIPDHSSLHLHFPLLTVELIHK